MRMVRFSALVLVLLFAFASGCGTGGVGNLPELLVFVDDDPVSNGDKLVFGKDQDEMKITLWNSGGKALNLESVKINEAGNSYIKLIDEQYSLRKPVLDISGTIGVPMALQNTEQGNTTLDFLAVYWPEDVYDDRESTLTVTSDDPRNPVFTLTLSPFEKMPRIKVNPNNYTFVNATKANPGFAEFTITNEGSDDLVISAVSFKNPSDEFSITNPPNKDSVVHPPNTGQGSEELKFTVRYAPTDTPDQNKVIIKSNDPVSPDLSIVVRGETQAGQLSVTYADQATGCMDFTKTTDPGDTCTRVVNLANVGDGVVTISKPVVEQGVDTAYAVEWYEQGGSQVDDGAGCGEFQGTPILGPLSGLASQRSLDIGVTYTAPGAKGVNGMLVINYQNPKQGTEEIPLCGGAPKGKIDLAPQAGSQVMFYALEGETKQKTVVIMNKGNGDITIRGVEIEKAYPDLDPDAFFIKDAVPPDTVLSAWDLLPITVEFTTDYEAMYLNATFIVTYEDPTTGVDEVITAPLKGTKDFEGVELPTADPGTTEDYADAIAGNAFILDGSGSTSGTFPIFENGYTWFVSGKPLDSNVFLNKTGASHQVSIIPDVAGDYEFRLVVFSQDEENSLFYFSDEASVVVVVE